MVRGAIGRHQDIASLAIMAAALSILLPPPAVAQSKQTNNASSEADQVKSLSGVLDGVGPAGGDKADGPAPAVPATSDLWSDVQAWNRQEASREAERQRLAAIEAERRRAVAAQAERERALAAQNQSSDGGFLDTLLNVATAGVATYSASQGVYNPALMSAVTGGEAPLPNIVPVVPVRPPQAAPIAPTRPSAATAPEPVHPMTPLGGNQQPVWDATKQPSTTTQRPAATAQAPQSASLPAPNFRHSGSWRSGSNGAADYVISIANNGGANLQCTVAIAAQRYRTSSSYESYGTTESFRDQRTAFVYRGGSADVDWRGLTGPHPNYTVNCRSVN